VDFPDLDLELQSANLLVKVAGLFYKSRIRDVLRKKARFPIADKLEMLKVKMTKALNRPLGRFANLKTQVETLEVWDLYADKQAIVVRTSIKGNAALEVTWN
jgi:hypothetical protein